MSTLPLYFAPGICKAASDYAGGTEIGYGANKLARGRFKDGAFCRFVAGFPEKVLGWNQAIQNQMVGPVRGMKDWRDNSQVIRTILGTAFKLYVFSINTLTDITPFRGILTGTLSNPFVDNNGVFTVTHTGHQQQTNDFVMLTASAAVDSLTAAGVYQITVVDANTYTVTVGTTSGTSSGGGTVSYTYFRKTLGSNPFSTTSGSPIVTVTDNSHGAIPNDFVAYSGASAVAGLTISGEYQILSTTTNTYTINVGSNANATTTGGGSTVSAQYDINSGFQDATLGTGYGTGGYGTNGYGTQGTTNVLLLPRVWTFSAYGQQMMACPAGGGIYVWDPTIGGRALPLYGAPSTNLAMFVTPERFVTALGISGNNLEIAWPDQNNDTIWTSLATNTANSGRVLQGGSYLVNGIPLRDGVSLIFSNTRCWTHTYIGDNNIYQDAISGENCGLIGPLAVAVYEGIAYWMSFTDFYSWNGAVQALPSDDIRDFVFKNLNLNQTFKFYAHAISSKKVIRFGYVDNTASEINRWVEYHIDQGCWSISPNPFTCGLDQGLYPNPLSADAGGFLYNIEIGTDANGSAIDSYITFDPVDAGTENGQFNLDIMGFLPDMQRQSGNLNWSVLLRQSPNDADTVDGPYTVLPGGATSTIDLRNSGRMVGFELESNVVGGDWRLGLPRIEVQKAGARRPSGSSAQLSGGSSSLPGSSGDFGGDFG